MISGSRPKRLVIDVNVLVSALFANGQPARLFEDVVRGEYAWLSCDEYVLEINSVFGRKKFDAYDARTNGRARLHAALGLATHVPLKSEIEEGDDVKDRYLLALALDGAADAIVSGDKHLLVLHPWRGIDILRPAEFIETERRRMDS